MEVRRRPHQPPLAIHGTTYRTEANPAVRRPQGSGEIIVKCTVEDFADRLRSRAVQLIVSEGLDQFKIYLDEDLTEEEKARLEVSTGVDFDTLRMILRGLIAEMNDGRTAAVPRESVSVDLSSGIKMRITGSPTVMAGFMGTMNELLGPSGPVGPGPCPSGPQGEPGEPGMGTYSPPPMFAASRPHSALDDDGKCPRCGGTFKMRGMAKHLGRCSKGVKPEQFAPSTRKFKRSAYLPKSTAAGEDGGSEGPVPPTKSEAVAHAGAQCLGCGEFFANAKILSAHQMAKHFVTASYMGSSLKEIA